MEPWMSKKDIELIENEILSLGKSHLSILEWGSGGSTNHFSKFLEDNNITYDWVSIEYNREWYNKVCDLKIPNVNLKLFDVGNTKLKQREINMDEYVSYPMGLKKKFDFILVDGRKRRRCLLNASLLVKDDGIVMLHDAHRDYYHCAFKKFTKHEFLSKTLWAGRAKKLISVIMPAWNTENHILLFRDALNGIVNQTYSNWELIIVCDSGLDSTVKCVKEEVDRIGDSRIKIMASKEKHGPGIIRNMAYKHANGRYVMFHDSDDLSIPSRFEKLVSAIDANGVIASSLIVKNTQDGSKRTKSYSGDSYNMLIEHRKVRTPICMATTLMTRGLFERMGGFEQYMYSSDSIFAIKLGYLRTMTNEGPIPIIKEPLYIYNRHHRSVSKAPTNASEVKKCQRAQRNPLMELFRDKILDGRLSVGDPEAKIKKDMGLIDNISPAEDIFAV